MALARPAARKDEQRQRVGHFPAGHRQIANELVGRLADHAQPFHVAQNLAGQIGMTAQLQRLGFVGVGHQARWTARSGLAVAARSFPTASMSRFTSASMTSTVSQTAGPLRS